MSLKPQFTNPQVLPDGLPDLMDVEYAGLSKNYFWSKLIQSLLYFGIMFLLLSTYLSFETDFFTTKWKNIILLGFLLWMAFVFFRVYKVYQKKAFAIRVHDIIYKSGWIWKKVVTIPFNRIQHCELNSGPVDRAFDLTVLNVYTAGGSRSDLSIPGLSKMEGQKLKAFILSKINSNDEEE